MMDYEETSAPVRYALDDHDSDEELEASKVFDKVTIKIETQVTTPSTLIIGLDQPGKVYVQSLLHTQPAGTILRQIDNTTETKARLYQHEDTLLIAFDAIVPEEAHLYTQAMMQQWKVNKMIVLDSFRAVGYVSHVWGEDLVPPFLRVLQTSVSEHQPKFTLFKTPNMVQGLSAAILNHCEIHQMVCYDLLSFQESMYGQLLVTNETLTAYETGLSLLGYQLKLDQGKLSQMDQKQSSHRLYL